ncbi:MAG TPA: tRNA uridine-5-carboxymethylaminomethyl(34) synthesis GTPase MnmE [Terriglobales bacterium]|nr:tRNA uridine-5-carboxymethylaminomethyl(34) synthesis GTPase MnmE [Terriglobales bacterium]
MQPDVHMDDTTIVAIATAPGRGGIGVVRLSGPQARTIAAPMLRLTRELEAGRAIFGELLDVQATSDQRLDEVVVTYFPAPHSYTTEDVVEISAHGSPVILRRIVEMALAGGARLAEPGEFTMRAFLHGRIDLTQAEAVRDLIDSQTLFQAKTAAQQLEGSLSRRIQPIKKMLVELIATLEAGVDFAEDDISVLPADQILDRIAKIQVPLQQLADSFAFGKMVHEGLTLAIVGRPNVGKSSLFNRLVERDRAIVTSTPGTTRDLVSETVALNGIPIHLIDTAGIHAAGDEAERIGIQKSYEALADADVVLVVSEANASPAALQHDAKMLAALHPRKAILVANKSDLAQLPAQAVNFNGASGVGTSALTGDGIADLRQEILRQMGGDHSPQLESGFLTNTRHQELIKESLAALTAAQRAVQTQTPHEMLLLDLYATLRPLDALTGQTSADDILHLIFGTFCIGK